MKDEILWFAGGWRSSTVDSWMVGGGFESWESGRKLAEWCRAEKVGDG
jgi:hypothetical protein